MDEKHYPRKIYSGKEDFVPTPIIEQIFSESSITDAVYYKPLLISKDDDNELHLIRPPILYFVHCFFEDDLKA